MELLENLYILRTLLSVAGIRNLSARTDTPAAIIELHFERGGMDAYSTFTVEQLLDSLTPSTIDGQSQPQGSFTDIADIP